MVVVVTEYLDVVMLKENNTLHQWRSQTFRHAWAMGGQAMPGQWVGKPFPMQHTYTCPSSYGHQYNIFKMYYVSSYTTVCKMTNINLIEANA